MKPISIFERESYVWRSTLQTAAPPTHKRPFIILYGPQLSSGLRDGDVMLQSPHHLANLTLLSCCVFSHCVRHKSVIWKTLLGKLVGLKISDGVVVKGVLLTRLKRHKRFGLFHLWRSTGIWQDIQEGTCEDKVLISELQTHFSADHVKAFIFKAGLQMMSGFFLHPLHTASLTLTVWRASGGKSLKKFNL